MEHDINFHVDGIDELKGLLFELAESREKVPEGLALGHVELNLAPTGGANGMRIGLKPSEGLLELIAASRAREV